MFFGKYRIYYKAENATLRSKSGVEIMYPSEFEEHIKLRPDTDLNFLFMEEICVLTPDSSGSFDWVNAYFRISFVDTGEG